MDVSALEPGVLLGVEVLDVPGVVLLPVLALVPEVSGEVGLVLPVVLAVPEVDVVPVAPGVLLLVVPGVVVLEVLG